MISAARRRNIDNQKVNVPGLALERRPGGIDRTQRRRRVPGEPAVTTTSQAEAEGNVRPAQGGVTIYVSSIWPTYA
jgi:hypothetical protein